MFPSPDSFWFYAAALPTAGDLVRSADEALYAAKRTGRDRVNHVRIDAVS